MRNWIIIIVLIYFVCVNLWGLYLMGEDKRRSIKKSWRVPEKKLFLASLLGGSLGTWAGMYLYRHKTKHWYFVIGMPLILFVQLGLGLWLLQHIK